MNKGTQSADRDSTLEQHCKLHRALPVGDLLPVIESQIDFFARTDIFGRRMKAASIMRHNGIPIDVEMFKQFRKYLPGIRKQLIVEINWNNGLFVERFFNSTDIVNLLTKKQILFPQLLSGVLDLKDDTFKGMNLAFTEVDPLMVLLLSLSQLRLSKYTVGDDGRNHCTNSSYSILIGNHRLSPYLAP